MPKLVSNANASHNDEKDMNNTARYLQRGYLGWARVVIRVWVSAGGGDYGNSRWRTVRFLKGSSCRNDIVHSLNKDPVFYYLTIPPTLPQNRILLHHPLPHRFHILFLFPNTLSCCHCVIVAFFSHRNIYPVAMVIHRLLILR